MRTPEEYKQSLKDMRPNLFKFGELIDDVTTHPATKRTVEGHARLFEAAQDPELEDLFTTTSMLTGKKVSRYLSIMQSAEDVWANSKMKRKAFNMTGTCTGGRCVGYASLNSLFATTFDMDQELGTEYHQRLRKWLEEAQDRDITCAGALSDPKGDRTKTPHEQEDPDMSLRIVEYRDDGIVVRGAKIMICGVAAANEIFVLPGTGYKEEDKDYCVAFVVPRDIEKLTIVEARHPSDKRCFEEGFDNPVACGGITQAYLLFDDVFVPNERVLMAGEDVMRGAAALIARANGLDEKVFSDKLTQMAVNNETTYAVGIAAAALGKKHPSGAWLCDPLLSNVNKVHVGTLPYETKRLTQDIAGGIAETGCMPSYEDLQNPEYGEKLKKYLKAAGPAEERIKIARLIEWLTIGEGVPGCMHGGGSPDGAKLIIRGKSGLKEHIEYAKKLAGITDW
jgi:4-hydroxybutyryl-CoA dehydratase/vinylacetyl-CoA-Delta-isomerase